jgi:hypothetical protein
MSADYIIYSPLSPSNLAKLVATCQEQVDEWYLDHDSREDQWGEFFIGGDVPSPGDAAAMVVDEDGIVAPVDSDKTEQVLERLGDIKSAITIERPGNIDTDKMQVSILRYLLEGAGLGLVKLVDVIELSEVVLEEVKMRDGAEGFGDEAARERHAAADDDDATPEPLAADGPVDPVFRAVFNMLAELQRDGSLDVEPHFDAERATEAIIRSLSKSGGRDVGGTVAKVLLKARGVEELYLDDDELAKRIEALGSLE